MQLHSNPKPQSPNLPTGPYPFGMVMQGRSFALQTKYRYGFNGKELDADIGSDNYDFGARIYDARIGRWMAVDPLYYLYLKLSPYSFVANNPTQLIDIDGRKIKKPRAADVYTGPAVPTCFGEMAETKAISTFDFETQEDGKRNYNFIVTTFIIYSSDYKGLMEIQYKPIAFDQWLKAHEEEHISRYNLVADMEFTFTKDIFSDGNVVNLTGTLDVLASKIYNESILPKMNEVKKTKTDNIAKLFDDFVETTKDLDVDSEEYKSAFKNYKDDAAKEREKEKLELDKIEESFNNCVVELLKLYKDKSKELNKHQGETGVNITVQNKLPKLPAAYQSGDQNIFNQKGVIIKEACTPEDAE